MARLYRSNMFIIFIISIIIFVFQNDCDKRLQLRKIVKSSKCAAHFYTQHNYAEQNIDSGIRLAQNDKAYTSTQRKYLRKQ